MLEFYWAYADVNQMMDFCEQMVVVFGVGPHARSVWGAQPQLRRAVSTCRHEGEPVGVSRGRSDQTTKCSSYSRARRTGIDSTDVHHQLSKPDFAPFESVAGEPAGG